MERIELANTSKKCLVNPGGYHDFKRGRNHRCGLIWAGFWF
jgi:hypothetical protein